MEVKRESTCSYYDSKWELDSIIPINDGLDLNIYNSYGLDVYLLEFEREYTCGYILRYYLGLYGDNVWT